MLSFVTIVQSWLVSRGPAIAMRNRARDDAGQATIEYALVMVGVAAVAVLLIGWATKTDRIGKLFDFVIDNVSGRVK
jgi:Flp pilus assembly pilin Flp